MTLAPARVAAFGALLAVDRGSWSAEALQAKCTHLDSRDAGLASEITFGTLRRRGELDVLIQKLTNRAPNSLDPEVLLILEMSLYQLRYLERVPDHAAVNDGVELVKRSGRKSAAPFVNAVLRRALREKIDVPMIASTPNWLFEGWQRQYGKETAVHIAAASLLTPERFLRVGKGVPPEGALATEIPGCYKLSSGDPAGYRFQDIGSQAVVPLLDLQPGMSFLDLCASPGNKTAQALETPLHAIACDIHLSRAKLLESLEIPVLVLDASKPLPFEQKFDRILVDAPCSGTGTLSRNPEIKWNLKFDDIADLADRQLAILKNALTALAPGGRLVYSTCSLEREENEEIVSRSGAQILQTMQRIPGRDPGDGFFAAVLQNPKS